MMTAYGVEAVNFNRDNPVRHVLPTRANRCHFAERQGTRPLLLPVLRHHLLALVRVCVGRLKSYQERAQLYLGGLPREAWHY